MLIFILCSQSHISLSHFMFIKFRYIYQIQRLNVKTELICTEKLRRAGCRYAPRFPGHRYAPLFPWRTGIDIKNLVYATLKDSSFYPGTS